MENKYFVVLRRLFMDEDVISIFEKEEAIKRGWIAENGDRVWVVPPQEEKTITFVWGFVNIDAAITFYECLQKNELGITCREV